jgi:cysteine desulfurase
VSSGGPAEAVRQRPSPPAGYLDAAAGEPLHPAAREAWLAAVEDGWADPSRLYAGARRARLLLDDARESVAATLGCRADEVSFTGSGTQAVHLGVTGLALGRRRAGRRTVASAVEHSSVLHALRALDVDGADTMLVGVDRTGRVDAGEFVAALTDGTAFACLQPANQEVGTAQPLAEIAVACERLGVPLLVDAAQSVGRAQPPQGWSVLAASAHKWGGPPGVGVLAVRTGTRWRSPSPADDRTSDSRVPGFEDVPGAVASAAALSAVAAAAPAEDARLARLTALLREQLPLRVPDTVVLGAEAQRLPHLAAFALLYVEGEALLGELDAAGFSVGSGSACSSSALEPSHVLVAMGALTHGNLRLSLPRGVAEPDVDRLLDELPAAVARVRERLGAAEL